MSDGSEMTGAGSQGWDEPPEEEAAEARKQVQRTLGSAVAGKASPRFLVATARSLQQAPEPTAIGLEQLTAFRASPSAPAPTIVEFSPAATGDAPLPADRGAAVQSVRTEAYRTMGAVYDEIERVSTGSLLTSGTAVGTPGVSSLLNQVCWLNNTVRTFAHPVALAEVAADEAVTTLDVPRRLVAEAWQPNLRSIGVPAFRTATDLTGKEMIVAIIDSEVALRHPALAGRVVHRRNFTAEGWGSPHAHGTTVAGIVAAAADVDHAHEGIAPDVVLYNYKVLAGPISAEDFGGSLAIQLAVEDGAVVANCSWGSGPAGDGTGREARAVDAAWALGMVVVKSSGNSGPGSATMTSPADASGIIVVGATDVHGKAVQDYSSRGQVNGRPGPHLVAPGGTFDVRIESCEVAGGFVATTTPGTSFAAPHVTGMAALLAEQQPEATPDQIRDQLVAAALPLDGHHEAAQGAGFAQLPRRAKL